MITKSNELRHKLVKTEEIMRALSRLISRARLGEQADKMQETLENGEAVGRRHPLEDLCNEIERILDDTSGNASRGTLYSSTRSRFSSTKARPKTMEQPNVRSRTRAKLRIGHLWNRERTKRRRGREVQRVLGGSEQAQHGKASLSHVITTDFHRT